MLSRIAKRRAAAVASRVARRFAHGISDAPFNLFEIAKQAALLEMHFAHPNCACEDCILKHLLTIEGLCEEMPNLDRGRELLAPAHLWAEVVRDLREAWMRGTQDVLECATRIRELRKDVTALAAQYAREEWAEEPSSAVKVAHRHLERRTCPRCSCR